MARSRDKLVAFFVTESEKEMINKLAKMHGMNFSEFVRYCTIEKNKSLLRTEHKS